MGNEKCSRGGKVKIYLNPKNEEVAFTLSSFKGEGVCYSFSVKELSEHKLLPFVQFDNSGDEAKVQL